MSKPQFDVIIVGAGFAGMYLLHRCRQLGLTARVWEAGGGVGGTWYWNRYPGARCDVESMQYSYQFDDALQQEWDWSEHYSPQPEILRYAEHVAERYALLDGIDFERRVRTARYDEAAASWTLESDSGESVTARICVMATGCLSVPNWPKIDGYDQFEGVLHHTALWPPGGVDVAGKRVAVIGTGSSAIQSIPHIAAAAESVTVFQRTPNYSIPAHNRPMDATYAADIKAEYSQLRARAKQAMPGIDGRYNTGTAMEASEEERLSEYERRWQEGGLLFMAAYSDLMFDQSANDSLVKFVHNKIRSIVHDQDVAELLCPENIIGGKRLCVDSNYYETFNRPNVTLIDVAEQPVSAINAGGVRIGETQYDVDVIVIATGFDAMTGALTNIDIRGKADVSLRNRWRNGPSSYLGLAMVDFPNLFTVTGPGSPSVFTNMLPTIEQHVEWITDCIAHLQSGNYTSIEATADAQTAWWEHVQEVANLGLKQTTDSWYVGANVDGKARVFMPYYGGFPGYCAKCEEVVANGYEGFALN